MILQQYSGKEIMQKLNSDEQFATEFMNECNRMCAAQVRSNNYDLGDWTIEDLALECMVKVIGNLEKYDNTYSFNTWYSKICSNIFYKHYNYYKKYNLNEVSTVTDDDNEEVSILDTISAGIDVENTFIKDQNTAWHFLLKEIDEMNVNYREAIKLCYLNGCSVKDAAHRLSVNESTVNNWLARGRKKLKNFCDEYHLEEDLYYEAA